MQDRKTEDPKFHGSLLYAKDLVSGGTWCGLNTKTGNVCILTNVGFDEANTNVNAVTRGKLVTKFLNDLDYKVEDW